MYFFGVIAQNTIFMNFATCRYLTKMVSMCQYFWSWFYN